MPADIVCEHIVSLTRPVRRQIKACCERCSVKYSITAMKYSDQASISSAIRTNTTPSPTPLQECLRHTDLEWRLKQIPDTAKCRGAFLNTLDDRAADLGEETRQRYRNFFQTYHFSIFKLFPVRDYLTRIMVLSQIHFGTERIYEGLFHIHRFTFPAWKKNLLGRAAFAMVGSNLEFVLKVMEKGYQGDHFVNYAGFSFERLGPDHFLGHFTNEYVYIEHAIKGGVAGAGDACNLKLDLTVSLKDPFNGDIDIRVL
jgi:hypothetical protein